MNLNLQRFFRVGLAFLLVAGAWSLWAASLTNTNPPSADTSNAPSTLVRGIEHFEEHPLTFKLDRVPFLRETTLIGEPLWKYLASLIWILLAFYAAKLIDYVTQVWLRRLAAKTATPLDDLLLDLLHGPVKIVVFVLLLNIGLNLFDWSATARLYLSKGLLLVVAGSLTYLAIKIVNLLLTAWRHRHAQGADRKFDEQLFSVIRSSLNTFIILVAVLVTAQNMNINITAALASLSIGGLAVGLAAQDTLANVFGAVAMFVDKPFRVGEQIKLDGAEGIVEAVGLRSTRVRNPDGHLVAIPNKTMGNAIITNISRRPNIRTVMNLTLLRTLPAEKVKRALEILDELYRSNPMTEQVWVSLNQFTAAGLNVLIIHWWKGTDYQKNLLGLQQINVEIKTKFDAEGIALA